MVVSFAEGAHSTPQCNLHMWWLHATMCEVGSELQAAFHVVWVLVHHPTPLEFDRNAEDVLPSQGNSISPLAQVSNYSESDGECIHLFAFGIGRYGDQQKGLEDRSDDCLRFWQLVP